MHAVLMLAVLSVAVPDRDDPNKKDVKPAVQEQLLGEWQLVKAVLGAKEEVVGDKNLVLHFEKDVIHVRENGEQKPRDDAAYRLDASKTPMAFDLMPKTGMEKIEGILKLEGDSLTICFPAGPMAARPTGFVATPETPVMLMVFKRIKK